MNIVNQLEGEVALGLQTENFLGGPIGRFLIGRAEAEIEAAVEELKNVSPYATEEIRTLQNTIHRAESIQYWLAEAIQAGQNAQQELLDDHS